MSERLNDATNKSTVMSEDTGDRQAITIMLTPAKWCLVTVFSALIGYSKKACDRKRERGDWAEGDVWIKGRDGLIQYSLEGYYRWVEGARAPGSTARMDTSESASPTPSLGDAVKSSTGRTRQRMLDGLSESLPRSTIVSDGGPLNTQTSSRILAELNDLW